ncbi:MAG: hypothetical protein Phog2KO_32930 [Phototrophicaceae bacterium]
MSLYNNPFSNDSDEYHLWQMLVERDIEAFLAGDWSLVEDDFLADSFTAIDAQREPNPDNWRLSFTTLADYRESWLEQSADMRSKVQVDTLRAGIINATTMDEIEVKGESALLHKKFQGEVIADDGERITMQWQTLYQCKRVDGQWKIAGFVGYLPYPLS